jgi:dTDP-4-amino-4,6-dideoxygalactose transaminase
MWVLIGDAFIHPILEQFHLFIQFLMCYICPKSRYPSKEFFSLHPIKKRSCNVNTQLAINGGPKVRTTPFPPWPQFNEDQIKAVETVLRSGKVNYWTGNSGQKFQQEFADFCGAQYGIAVMNGTAALHVALAAAGIGPGDEVIVPPRTFIATAFSVMHQMAIPVFADIELKTQNISPKSIEENITPRTKAIICVHLAGLTCNMEAIMDIAQRHNLIVIEDAAQAHGAEFKGVRAGNLGHIAAFSFCNDKHFTTGGEGGMVTTNNPEMAEIARSFKDHGYQEVERRNLLELEALYTYIHHRMGYNYRMTEMQAAIGLEALKTLDWNINRRRENAHYLTEHLSRYPALQTPYESPDYKHSFYKYYVRIDLNQLSVDRDQFVKAVRTEGVPVGLGTSGEVYREKAFQELVGFSDSGYPFKAPLYPETPDYKNLSLTNAKRLASEVFVLQVHPTIENKDLKDVVDSIDKVLSVYQR